MTRHHRIPATQSQPVCAITLIDRRTGLVHRVNGAPMRAFSRDPDTAAAELLAGRDPSIWQARIDPLPVG